MKHYKFNILFYSILLINSADIYASVDISGTGGTPNIITGTTDYVVVGENNTIDTSKKMWVFGEGNGSSSANNVLLNGSDNETHSGEYVSFLGARQYGIYSSHVESLGNFNDFFHVEYGGVLGSYNTIGDYGTESKYIYGMGNLNKIGTTKNSSHINFITTNSNLSGSNINAMGDSLSVNGNNNTLIGNNSTLTGNNSIGIGYTTTITGNDSTAIGSYASSLANNGTAIGTEARANATNSVAVGYLANVSRGHDDSIALGAHSNADGVSLAQQSYLTNQTATSELNIANGLLQRRITGVAGGALDTDAVNVAQLKAVTAMVSSISGGVQYDKNSDGSINKDSVTLAGGVNGTKVTNVAAGTVAENSKDAVNGSQLNATNQALVSALGGGAAYNNSTQSFTNPTYQVGSSNYYNVGDAIDALNKSDININNRIDNIEQSVSNMNKSMDDLRKETRSGIAAAMAVGSLPQPSQAGKSMVSAAISTHSSEGAVALGVSGITRNEKYVYKAGAGVDTQSSFSGSLSVGYQW